MPSIFDLLFGGGQQASNPAGGATPPFNPNGQRTPSILDSPEYGQQRMSDALSGMAQALIQAGAPSAQPRGFLDAFGAAGAGALGGMQNSEDRFLKRTMINSQVRKNQQEMDNDKAWRDMFNGAGVTPDTSPTQIAAPSPVGSPTAGGGVSPNNIGNVRPVGGGPNSGFQQPASIEEGIQLAVNTAKAYPKAFNNGQPMSLLQIGERWAPKGDGANDPAQWARNVASIGGLPLDQPINLDDPAQAAAFARGVHGAEHGGKAIRPAEFYQAALTAAPQPAVAQGGGDASGNPVQQAQYQPPQPRTLQEVVAGLPPGMRQIIGGMDRKGGMAALLKYGFVTPAEAQRLQMDAEKLNIDRQQLANSQRKTDIDERNAPVGVGNDGRPIVNQQVIDAEGAKAGAKVGPEVTTELAKDAVKRNAEWQKAGMQAQSTIRNVSTFEKLADQVNSGRYKGTVTDMKAALKGAGIDLASWGIPDDIGPVQAMQMMSQRFALEMRQDMPGPMSDGDRAFMERGSVSVERDPGANKIMAAWLKGNAERAKDRAKFATEYIRAGGLVRDPAGIDAFVNEKLASKDYFDQGALPQQSAAPPGALPPPPAGFSVPGQPAPGGAPTPPAGFRIVR